MKGNKLLIITALVAVLSLSAIACTGSSDVDTGQKSDSDQESTSDGKPVTYKQSDSVEIDGKKISIEEVKIYTDYGEFNEPAEGKQFLAVKVKVENISNESTSYNALNYSLVDKDGAKYNEGAFTDLDPTFSSGELQPTRKASGYMVFEVPARTKTSEYELQYEPLSLTETSQVIWELN